MKILTVEQIREADQATIKNEPIKSVDLMERAAKAFTTRFIEHFSKEVPVQIFCGIGNNGGDGLAIGRMLINKGYHVEVYAIDVGKKFSEDFQINFDRLSSKSLVPAIKTKEDIPKINSKGVVIDAIFGSGLTRPAEGFFAEVIKAINQSEATTVVAVDIASGLFADKPVLDNRNDYLNNHNIPIVRVDYTYSFQVPKLAFFLPQNEPYVGKWFILDIGLDQNYIAGVDSGFYYLESRDISKFLIKRKKFAHKGDFGKALIIAGSYGKMGAAVLSLRGCLRSGAGLVTAHIPKCGYTVIQSTVPEAMVIADEDDNKFSGLTLIPGKNNSQELLADFDVLGIGPGLGTDPVTGEALANLFKTMNEMERPPKLVLDADALNICSQSVPLLNSLPNNTVLTPHPGEFSRLVGKSKNDFERIDQLKNFAREKEVYVVLKGGHSAVATPEGQVYFNATGNPGMASGGSGDLLTGIITSLLGQPYNTLDAVLLGVFIHGLAGDIYADQHSQEGLIAYDIFNTLPDAFFSLYKRN